MMIGNIITDKAVQDKVGYECYDIVVANILADVIIPLSAIAADFLKEDGHIVLNHDDDKLATVQETKGVQPLFFGIDEKTHIYADEIESKGLKGNAPLKDKKRD